MNDFVDSSMQDSLIFKEGHRDDAQQRKSLHREYKDAIFAILFIIHFAIILYLALVFGIKSLWSNGLNIISIDSNNQSRNIGISSVKAVGRVLFGTLFVLTIGGAMSISWIYLISYLSRHLITISGALVVSLPIIVGIVLIAYSIPLYGILSILSSPLLMLIFLYIKPRIKFASIILKASCEAVQNIPILIVYTIGTLGIHVCFCLLWSIAALGIATDESTNFIWSNNGQKFPLSQCVTYNYVNMFNSGNINLTCTSADKCTVCICGGSNIISNSTCFTPKVYMYKYILLLFSLFWTSTVLSNIIHTTVSNTILYWWHTPDHLLLTSKMNTRVFHSYYFSWTYSLGSVCLGSLFVAILKTLRTIIYFLDSNAVTLHQYQYIPPKLDYIFALFRRTMKYLLTLLDWTLQYFNRYAFVYVGIYGYDFFSASKCALLMLQTRGLSALINDDITDFVLSLSHYLIALVACLFGYMYGTNFNLGTANTTMIVLLGFFAGYLMCMATTKILSAAVATIYVLWGESAAELEMSHPDLYEELSLAWRSSQPSSSSNSNKPVTLHHNPTLNQTKNAGIQQDLQSNNVVENNSHEVMIKVYNEDDDEERKESAEDITTTSTSISSATQLQGSYPTNTSPPPYGRNTSHKITHGNTVMSNPTMSTTSHHSNPAYGKPKYSHTYGDSSMYDSEQTPKMTITQVGVNIYDFVSNSVKTLNTTFNTYYQPDPPPPPPPSAAVYRSPVYTPTVPPTFVPTTYYGYVPPQGQGHTSGGVPMRQQRPTVSSIPAYSQTPIIDDQDVDVNQSLIQ